MKLGRRGTTALEFAMVVPPLMVLMFSCIEFGRLLWTWQGMQLAGDQVARCVAISGAACTTPSSYAISQAANFGVVITAAAVTVANTPPSVTNATACSPPGGNTATQVKLSLAFSSPVSLLIPALAQTLTTTSCYPWTGK
jgi:Flp pilus assembly protein TadG